MGQNVIVAMGHLVQSALARLCLVLAVVLLGIVASTRAVSAQDGGPMSLSGATAADTSMGRMYMAQEPSSTVFVLSLATSQLITILKVPPRPSAIAVDTTHHLVYVASDSAGMITVFDSSTEHLLRIYPIGGRPSGLILVGKGRTLLVTDGTSGNIEQYTVWTRHGLPLQVQSSQVFAPNPQVALLAPPNAAIGQDVVAWAAGFIPGETVELSWGSQLIGRGLADGNGDAVIHLTVPRLAGDEVTGLKQYLVILYGQLSTTTRSAILQVIPTPPAPRPHVVKKAASSPLAGILAMSIAIPLPSSLARIAPKGLVQTVPSAQTAKKPGNAPTTGHSTTTSAGHSPSAATNAATQYSLRLPIVALAAIAVPVLGGMALIIRKRRHRKASTAASGRKRSGRKKRTTAVKPAA